MKFDLAHKPAERRSRRPTQHNCQFPGADVGSGAFYRYLNLSGQKLGSLAQSFCRAPETSCQSARSMPLTPGVGNNSGRVVVTKTWLRVSRKKS